MRHHLLFLLGSLTVPLVMSYEMNPDLRYRPDGDRYDLTQFVQAQNAYYPDARAPERRSYSYFVPKVSIVDNRSFMPSLDPLEKENVLTFYLNTQQLARRRNEKQYFHHLHSLLDDPMGTTNTGGHGSPLF